jgi:hypothetical protein
MEEVFQETKKVNFLCRKVFKWYVEKAYQILFQLKVNIKI